VTREIDELEAEMYNLYYAIRSELFIFADILIQVINALETKGYVILDQDQTVALRKMYENLKKSAEFYMKL